MPLNYQSFGILKFKRPRSASKVQKGCDLISKKRCLEATLCDLETRHEAKILSNWETAEIMMSDTS